MHELEEGSTTPPLCWKYPKKNLVIATMTSPIFTPTLAILTGVNLSQGGLYCHIIRTSVQGCFCMETSSAESLISGNKLSENYNRANSPAYFAQF